MATSVIIAGGGTAGHTNPGIATAKALIARGIDPDSIRFIGAERGSEGTLVPAAGFTIDVLPGRGIQRKLTPANLGSIIDLAKALIRSFGLIRRHRPSVVLCLGGYAAFGPSVAALARRVPVVVTEQNARASLVNRIIGRFARTCALPFPDTDLPNGVLTGNPILPEIAAVLDEMDRNDAKHALGLPGDRLVLAVWSGSLGATRINAAVRELADRWRDRTDVVIHHVIGRRDWPTYGPGSDELADAPLDYRTIEYETRMPLLLAAADLAVTRAGASSVSELAVAGLPAVLVPLPGAPRDHQRANTAELVESGGGLLLLDADVDAERLDQLLTPMLTDTDRRSAMSASAAAVGRPDAADRVAELVITAGQLERS